MAEYVLPVSERLLLCRMRAEQEQDYRMLSKYRQAKTVLHSAIADGTVRPKEQLPPLRNLAGILKVGLSTLKRSVDELTSEKYLESRPREGVFVASVTSDGYVNRFERFQDRDGHFYVFDHEVLAINRAPADIETAEALEIAPNGPSIWSVKRLLKSNGELVILDEVFLSPAFFREDAREKLERLSPGQSMYAYFESEFCQKIASCSDVLHASFAHGDLVGYGFPEGSCVVVLERIARNPKGEVLEFRRMTAVASKVQFAVEE